MSSLEHAVQEMLDLCDGNDVPTDFGINILQLIAEHFDIRPLTEEGRDAVEYAGNLDSKPRIFNRGVAEKAGEMGSAISIIGPPIATCSACSETLHIIKGSDFTHRKGNEPPAWHIDIDDEENIDPDTNEVVDELIPHGPGALCDDCSARYSEAKG
jgi:hypothetical protein